MGLKDCYLSNEEELALKEYEFENQYQTTPKINTLNPWKENRKIRTIKQRRVNNVLLQSWIK